MKRSFLFTALLAACSALTAPASIAQTLSTIAGTGNSDYNGENKPAMLVNIDGLTGGTTDEAGNIYYADNNNHRIRKISVNGIVTTICGTGTPGYNGDNIPATSAKVAGPTGFTTDKAGNLYFADAFNERVRKIDVSTGIITTIAGTGRTGYSGNGGKAVQATLQGPSAVAIDARGNIYVSDCDNNCIRKIDQNGIISTFAGNPAQAGSGSGSFAGDGGPAANASINHPKGITFDHKGNLLIADCFNHRIRKVAVNGIISTVAGNGNPGFTGDGIAAINASISYPYAVTSADDGSFYFSEPNINMIRMVDARGIISSVAGNGVSGFAADGTIASQGAIRAPSFLFITSSGDIVFGSNGNNRIRKINTAGGGGTSSNGKQPISLPVPAHAIAE